MMPRTSGTCRSLKRNLHNSAFGGRPTNPSSCHTFFVELPPCTSVSVSPFSLTRVWRLGSTAFPNGVIRIIHIQGGDLHHENGKLWRI